MHIERILPAFVTFRREEREREKKKQVISIYNEKVSILSDYYFEFDLQSIVYLTGRYI